MMNKQILFLGIFTLLIIAGCSQSIDKQIIGTWESVDKTDDCDDTMSSQISFYDDNTIVGIEGFKDYKIEETNNDYYDYAVLSGGYEDATKYRVKINKENNLNIVYEEEDIYDFNHPIACEMEKVND